MSNTKTQNSCFRQLDRSKEVALETERKGTLGERERESESEKLRGEEGNNDVNEKEELVFHSFATSWVNYRVSFLIWREIKAPQSGEMEERKQERRKYKDRTLQSVQRK